MIRVKKRRTNRIMFWHILFHAIVLNIVVELSDFEQARLFELSQIWKLLLIASKRLVAKKHQRFVYTWCQISSTFDSQVFERFPCKCRNFYIENA